MTYIGMQRYEIIQQERNSADTIYNMPKTLIQKQKMGSF